MPPSIAANMMVLNAASVLPRCLRSMRGVLDELVVIDTGSTDDTFDVVTSLVKELGIDRLYYERLHPQGPNFFTDEAETFRAPVPGPFTGRRMPVDWAAVRNMALDNTTADYVIKLDADDEAVCPPPHWLKTVEFLEARPDVDVVAAAYEVCDGRGAVEWLSMYDRMWRRLPRTGGKTLRWAMPFHEYLRGKTSPSTLYNVQGLRVRDHRDSPGDGVRVAHRNLKVLLRNWEQGERVTISSPADIAADLVERFTLGHEAAEVLYDLATSTLGYVLENLDQADKSMRADCYYHLGRACEARSHTCRQVGDVSLGDEMRGAALTYYEIADDVSPHVQALLRAHSLYLGGPNLERAAQLRERIFAHLGPALCQSEVFNTDLKLLSALRKET